MSFDGDAAYVVLETIAQGGAMTLKDVLDEVPFGRSEVMSVLTTLSSIGILNKDESGSGRGAEYSINSELSAYHITKAVEIGIDLADLATILPISEVQKQAALDLSAQASILRELDESARAQKKVEKPKSTANLPRDMIVETLERLALASEISIEDYARSNKESDEILFALKKAREQALKALKDYQSNLGKWDKGSGY